MKDGIALIGAFILCSAILGQFGIGHFRLYYGDDPHGCMKMEDRMEDRP